MQDIRTKYISSCNFLHNCTSIGSIVEILSLKGIGKLQTKPEEEMVDITIAIKTDLQLKNVQRFRIKLHTDRKNHKM